MQRVALPGRALLKLDKQPVCDPGQLLRAERVKEDGLIQAPHQLGAEKLFSLLNGLLTAAPGLGSSGPKAQRRRLPGPQMGGNPYGGYRQQSYGGSQQGYSQQNYGFDGFDGFDPFGFGFGFNGYSQQSGASYSGSDSPEMQAARNFVVNGRYAEARRVLDGMTARNARWYYLSSLANQGLGNSIDALQDARRAVQLDPNNTEYRMHLQRLQNPGRTYRTQTTYAQPGGIMRWCWSMILLNLLCNCCCGGWGFGWGFGPRYGFRG